MMNQKQMLGLGLFTMLVVVLMGLTCESRAFRPADRESGARRPVLGALGGATGGALIGGLAGGGRGAGIGAGVGAGVGLISGIAANESARRERYNDGNDEEYYDVDEDISYYADSTGTVQKKQHKFTKAKNEKTTKHVRKTGKKDARSRQASPKANKQPAHQ